MSSRYLLPIPVLDSEEVALFSITVAENSCFANLEEMYAVVGIRTVNNNASGGHREYRILKPKISSRNARKPRSLATY